MATPSPSTRRLRNFFGGLWHEAEATGYLPVLDPATGEILAEVPLSAASEVDRAVAAARNAQPAWAQTPLSSRVTILRRAQTALETMEKDLVEGIVREHGKTKEAASASLRRGLESLEFSQGIPHLLQGSTLGPIARGVRVSTSLEPLGVVAGITPFDFPAMIPLWMLPLAIGCGNAFLLKPSERVPITAERIVDAFNRAGVPPGILNLVHGGPATAEAVLAHPGVNAVAFIGSAETAPRVYGAATAHGKRAVALAGSKSYFVVLPDADLDRAVPAILDGAFGPSGPRSLAGAVVIAVGAAAEPLLEELGGPVEELIVGSGMDEATGLGPLNRPADRDRVALALEAAVREGAVVVREGTAPAGPGFYHRPVLLDRVRAEMPLSQAEVLGPLIAVIRAESLDEALSIINRSPSVGAASIFTASGESAERFRHRVETGLVGINVGPPSLPAAFPFVGWNAAGFGGATPTGPGAVAFYSRTRVVVTRWT
jgi:malonate-semialdehyde dehydrogenase (acetylating)/methylmalonate-semialdehyde dehydrogenase